MIMSGFLIPMETSYYFVHPVLKALNRVLAITRMIAKQKSKDTITWRMFALEPKAGNAMTLPLGPKRKNLT
jgi:hypothetical protein